MRLTFNKHFVGALIFELLILIVCTNAVSDNNPANNVLSVSVTTTISSNLTLVYVLVSNDSGTYTDNTTARQIIEDSNKLTEAMFPIPDEGIISNDMIVTRINLEDIPPKSISIMRRYYLIHKLDKIALSSTKSNTHVVGILPKRTFAESLGLNKEIGSAGSIGRGQSVIVEDYYAEYNKYLIAHEIAHNYNLCDEYDASIWHSQNRAFLNLCPNGDKNHDSSLDQECRNLTVGTMHNITACPAYTYKGLHPFQSSAQLEQDERGYDIFANLMGDPVITPYAWINNDSYVNILNRLSEQPTYSEEKIMISGLKYKNGSVEPMAVYGISAATDYYDNQSGPFSIVLKAGANAVFRINSSFVFREGFVGDGEETNVSYFVYVVPKQENITSIEFIYNGSAQQTINKSANTPHILLQSPMGGEIFLTSFNVTWNVSDLDNNTMNCLVQISNDGGYSWYTIAVDLNNSYLSLSNGDFSYGTDYRIRVLASDGFNTNSSESTSDFTIIPPPRVTVSDVAQVYSSEGHQLFEAAITNDGGQDLSSVAWRFNTSNDLISSVANTSLSINEELVVIIEYNYSSGGLTNISMLAFDDNKSVNNTHSAEVFVGDLRVDGLVVSLNGTKAVFMFPIYNNGDTPLSGINWTLNTGEKNISSSYSLNLSAYNSTLIVVPVNYSSAGNYSSTVTVWDSFNNDTALTNLFIPDFVLQQYSMLYQQDSWVVLSVDITNALDSTVDNMSWRFDSGASNISSISNGSLMANETMTLIIEQDYANYGDFITTIYVSDDLYSETVSLPVSILELAINNLEQLYGNSTLTIISYEVQNLFSSNNNVTWKMMTNDSGTILAQQPIDVSSNESVSIIIENNFTANANRTVFVGANTSSADYVTAITLS